MRIVISIDRAAAIRAGEEVYGRQVVTVPISEFSEAERELLAGYPSKDADADLSECRATLYTTSADAVAVHAILSDITSQRAEAQADKLANDQKITDATAEVLRTRRTTNSMARYGARRNSGGKIEFFEYADNPASCEYLVPDWPYYSDGAITSSPEAVQWETELAAARKAVEMEVKARAEANLLAAEAEKAASAKERADWIAAHGSDRLRACAAEGIKCEAVYLDERLAYERPGWKWYLDVPGEYNEPRNPHAEAFTILAEARKSVPSAKLVYAGDDNYAAMAEYMGRDIVYGWPEVQDA